jgi:hypothetical protein
MTQVFDITQARVTELKVLENCISSLKSLLGNAAAEYGKPPWKVVHVAGNQDFREVAKNYKLVDMPFIAIIVNTIRPSEEGYNDQAMYNGFYMGQLNSNTATPSNVVLHCRPTAVDMTVRVTAQTFSDIAYFAQRWIFRERDVQFALKTTQYNLPIKVKFNTDLSIPEEEFTEMGNLFVMQAQLTFYAYVGVLELQQAITKVNVNIDAYDQATNDSIPIATTTINRPKGSA